MPPHFRAHARRQTNLHCTVKRTRETGQRPALRHLPAIVRNLGLGGACIECDERFQLGEPLEISLPVATRWEPLDLSGAVVWMGGSRLGLSFAAGDPDGRLAEALPLLLEALSTTRSSP